MINKNKSKKGFNDLKTLYVTSESLYFKSKKKDFAIDLRKHNQLGGNNVGLNNSALEAEKTSIVLFPLLPFP